MANFSKHHLDQLQQQGKIKGYTQTNNTPKGMPGHSNDRSAGKDWLGWNLPYWANEKGLVLEEEFKFHPERGWRFDWAIASRKIAVEFEGGIYRPHEGQAGAHSTAALFTKDTEKYNWATVLGWRVIRVTAMNYKTIFNFLNQLIKQ